jgi:hypothetical protein
LFADLPNFELAYLNGRQSLCHCADGIALGVIALNFFEIESSTVNALATQPM